jgi:Co/Zn/Cd efflux system component
LARPCRRRVLSGRRLRNFLAIDLAACRCRAQLWDASTAIPLGLAFFFHSPGAERFAGRIVVLTILVSAGVAAFEAIDRLMHPRDIEHLWALTLAGAIGVAGNALTSRIRISAGKRLDSPALVADGNHARADMLASLAVIASAIAVALSAQIADPLIGLGITIVILKVAYNSWTTVQGPQT